MPDSLPYSPRRLAAFLILLAISQILWFSPVLRQGFILDDYSWLKCAELTRGDWTNLFTREISGFFRPLIHLAFSANYAFCGLDAWGYNAVNLALEILCVAGFAMLANKLLKSVPLAALATVIFATHSSHGEVVAWISARTSSMLGISTVAAVLAWLRWRATRQRGWHVVALLLFVLALLCKEEAVALLPVLFLVDRLCCREGYEHRPLRASLRPLIPFALVLVVYLVAQMAFQSKNLLVQQGAYRVHVGAAGHLYSRVAALFVSKRVVHWPWLETTFAVLLVGGGVVLWRAEKRWLRLAVFGVCWAVLALLPTLFFTHHDAARYRYVASMGSSLAWAALVGAVMTKLRRPEQSLAAVLAAVAIIVPLQAYDQWQRTKDWHARGQTANLVFAATKRAKSQMDGESICLQNCPIGDEVRPLVWLFTGVGPEKILLPTRSDEGCDGAAIRLRWDGASAEWFATR